MLYSHNLLKQYIHIDDTIANIGNQITLKSCELEEIKTRIIPDTVVIGEVTDVQSHPNADKLVICQIECGPKGKYQICTAAENVQRGYYVPVALPGTHLPKLGITIETRKMRGEESAGMICAKEELGIMEDLDLHGIRNMQPVDGSKTNKSSGGKSGSNYDCRDITEQDLGRPLTIKYPRLNNHIIDVENKTITNRPDLTGHFGLAQELHAIYSVHESTKVQTRAGLTTYKDLLTSESASNNTTDTLIEAQTDDLRTYTAIQLNDIHIQASTFQTRLTLLDLGLQPRNNRVDFSNIFMYHTGQPIHCFDSDKITGNIIVRKATQGEEFIDLFEKKHKLTIDDIVIADQEKILALAGIIGGISSGVTNETQNITVEIANFDPIVVRKTAIRLGLRTDAIMRYEKDIAPDYTARILPLFKHIAKEHQEDLGTFVRGDHQTYTDDKDYRSSISINTAKLSTKIFGEQKEYFDKIATKILTTLGCIVENHTVTIPVRRGTQDLTISEDIEEEIARIYGYEKILKQTINKPIAAYQESPIVQAINHIENIVKEQHHCDIGESYPRAHQDMLQLFDVDTHKLPTILNATSPETKNLANATLYQLLQQCTKNSKFYDELRLCNINSVWEKKPSQQPFNQLYGLINTTPNHTESKQVGIILYQKKKTDWTNDIFLDAKSIATTIIGSQPKLVETNDQHFHPKKQATLSIHDQNIGFIGELHPLINEKAKIETNAQIVYLSIDIPGMLFAQTKGEQKNTSYETLQDQIVFRDISFVVDKKDSFGSLITSMQNIDHVQAVNIFDIYQGKQLPSDKKSIALQIKIKGDGSMTTDHINTILNNAITAGEKTGAILRKNFEA